MKVRSPLVAGGLAAVLVLASCGGDDGSTKVGQVGGGPATVTVPADSVRVGEVVKVGDTELVVHGVQNPFDAGEQKPAGGSRLVAVDVELKNASSSSQVFSSFGQFELNDSTGKSYDPVVLRGKVAAVGGPAAPGASRRGLVVFEVPEASQGLLLVFKDRLAEKGDATVRLS